VQNWVKGGRKKRGGKKNGSSMDYSPSPRVLMNRAGKNYGNSTWGGGQKTGGGKRKGGRTDSVQMCHLDLVRRNDAFRTMAGSLSEETEKRGVAGMIGGGQLKV